MCPWDLYQRNQIPFIVGFTMDCIYLLPCIDFRNPHFGGLVSILDQVPQSIQKDFQLVFSSSTPFARTIFREVWKDGVDFDEIVIDKWYPKLRIDLRFLFLT